MTDHHHEAVYSAKQVAQRLGVSLGMLRRYAAALETVTEKPISQHPRDGRRYSAEQVQALLAAKAAVRDHPGVSIETALRVVLGHEGALTPPPPPLPSGDATELARALTEPLRGELGALKEQGSEGLDELRRIRAALEALVEQGKPRLTPTPEEPGSGPLTRLARWWLGRAGN